MLIRIRGLLNQPQYSGLNDHTLAKLYIDSHERGSKDDALPLFMCAMKIQILTSHVTM